MLRSLVVIGSDPADYSGVSGNGLSVKPFTREVPCSPVTSY